MYLTDLDLYELQISTITGRTPVFINLIALQVSQQTTESILPCISSNISHIIKWFTRKLCIFVTYLLTELSPSCGAANCATTQQLPSILWNPKV
jgi:hypothetical protein